LLLLLNQLLIVEHRLLLEVGDLSEGQEVVEHQLKLAFFSLEDVERRIANKLGDQVGVLIGNILGGLAVLNTSNTPIFSWFFCSLKHCCSGSRFFSVSAVAFYVKKLRDSSLIVNSDRIWPNCSSKVFHSVFVLPYEDISKVPALPAA